MSKFERRKGRPVSVQRANTVFNVLADVHQNRITLAVAAKSFRKNETEESLRNLSDQAINLVNADEGFSVARHVGHMEVVRKMAWRVANVINRPDDEVLIRELLNIVESLRGDEKFTVGEMVLTLQSRTLLASVLSFGTGRKEEIIDDYAEMRVEEGFIEPYNKNCNPGLFRTLTRRKVDLYKHSRDGGQPVSMDIMKEFADIKGVFATLSSYVFGSAQLYSVLELLPVDLSNYEIRFLFNEVSSIFYQNDPNSKKMIFERLDKVLQLREFIYFGPTESELRMFLLDRVGKEGEEFWIDDEAFVASAFIKRAIKSGQNSPFIDHMLKAFRIELFKEIRSYGSNF